MNAKLVILARTATLAALTVLMQYFGFLAGAGTVAAQWIAGPLVNMMLLISVIYCGLIGGVAVGVVTPIIAYYLQIAPLPTPWMVPFIGLGNASLCLAFWLVCWLCSKKINKEVSMLIGIVIAGAVKFVYLFFAVSKLVLPLLLGAGDLRLDKLAVTFGVTQLFTALVGGTLCLVVVCGLRKAKVLDAAALLKKSKLEQVEST